MPSGEIMYHQLMPGVEVEQYLLGMTRCYRKVFSREPWLEWVFCTVCGHVWGICLEHVEALMENEFMCHGKPVQKRWPADKLAERIRERLTPDSTCILALQDPHHITGFCWACNVSTQEAEERLKLPGLANDLEREFDSQTNWVHLDELGVDPTHPNHIHIMEQLLRQRHRAIVGRGRTGGTVGMVRIRTSEETIPLRWYRHLGFRPIAHYHDTTERVVLARTLHDLEL